MFLNDIIINFYINILLSKEFLEIAKLYYTSVIQRANFYIFNTYFCLKVIEWGKEKTKFWQESLET